MKDEEYKRMLELLVLATKNKKLVWSEASDQSHKYFTTISGCTVCIWSDYDITIDDTSFFLTLSNPDGRMFATYSYSEAADKVEYDRLFKLFCLIQDNVYRISESERLIMDGLQNLVQDNDKRYTIK